MDNLAESVKACRDAKRWSTATLANEAGLTRSIVDKIIHGVNKKPSIVTMIKLADALEVSLDDLVGREAPLNNAGVYLYSSQEIARRVHNLSELGHALTKKRGTMP